MPRTHPVLTRAIRLLGLLAFGGSLAFTTWWWMRVASRDTPGGGLAAAAVDTLLFTAFALHHSLLARDWAQKRLIRLIPEDLLRTTYVLTASLLLTLTCLLWRPVGGVVYRVEGPAAMLLQFTQISGVVLTLVAVRRISLRELAGLDDPATDPGVPLQHSGPYRLVRHPIYLGWVLMVAAAPLMTSDRLLFAAISSGYLAVAIPFEEAGLLRKFGNSYRDYQRLVRWRLLPFVYQDRNAPGRGRRAPALPIYYSVAMATESPRTYPSELPALALRETVVFPLTLQPLAISRPHSIEAVNRALTADRLLFLTLQTTDTDQPDAADLKIVGTVAAIRQMAKVPNGGIHVIVEGLARGKADLVTRSGTALRATVRLAPEETERTLEVDAYVRRLQELIDRALSLTSGLSQELRSMVAGIDDPLRLAYLLSSLLDMKAEEKQQILEKDRLLDKLQAVASALNREIALLELKGKIESAAQQEMSDAQRQYYLRQQMKAIQDELGEGEKPEAQELRTRIAEAKLPEHVLTVAQREIDRLERMTPASPEYQMIRTYLDWLLDVPWSTITEDRLDPVAARQVLDEDHYDLDKVKERIVEYLAVQKLKTQQSGALSMKGPILCFVGPPGVGKTSLGQSIARAMNRKFVRISLGGVRDEAEIRGHRRTYIGSIPGRIVQALKQAGAMNPVFMLDEIDKIAVGHQGDPAAALLEVLDPAQNHAFRDHYLEVNLDLSRVLFIATSNQLGTIHPALLDRMEIIQLSGYTEEEKLHIAKRYLVPRQLQEHGLTAEQASFEDDALRLIASDYTREAGVRNLERQIGAVTRKIAARVAAATEPPAPTVVHEQDVSEYLGPPRFQREVSFRVSRPGVATGVAWTEVGGDVLFVEASLLPSGHHNLILTGQLGNVMQESARAAVSHIRASAAQLGIDADFMDKHDLHVHVPAGAIPKDGPSAGVTMATAIVSALRNQTVRPDVAMTGEITLSGLVLPVGGIREKALAAKRHGIKTFVLPSRNQADLAELPPEVKEGMEFVPATTLEDVLKVALPN